MFKKLSKIFNKLYKPVVAILSLVLAISLVKNEDFINSVNMQNGGWIYFAIYFALLMFLPDLIEALIGVEHDKD